jgi:hypothetical protein
MHIKFYTENALAPFHSSDWPVIPQIGQKLKLGLGTPLVRVKEVILSETLNGEFFVVVDVE